MIKPQRKSVQYFNYNSVIGYVESKYSIPNDERIAFWRWIVDTYNVHNGAIINLGIEHKIHSDTTPKAIKKMLGYIKKEFPELGVYSTGEIWVEW